MRWVRHLLIHIVLAAVCSGIAQPALAQSLAIPVASPAAVHAGGIRQDGLFMTAPIGIDGQPLFRIAASVNAPSGSLPIASRQEFIKTAISQILAQLPNGSTVYDPKTLKISEERDNNQYYLVASDKSHPDELPILTVTSADAQYNNLPIAALAGEWRSTLQTALVAALEKRQPEQIRHNIELLVRIAGAGIVLTILALLGSLALRRRIRDLEQQLADRREAMEREQSAGGDVAAADQEPSREKHRRFLALAIRTVKPEQRLRQWRAINGSILWLVLLLWAAGITWSLLLFPQTTQTAHIIINRTSRVVFIWIIAGLLNRIGDVIIARVADAYSNGVGHKTSEERARQMLRVPTISASLSGFKTFIIIFVAILTTLSALEIPVASVVTIGGVAALAIGFAAQSLVRDFMNGLLVLIEDQYIVGDYVMIGDFNGIVENLSLRVVQIRDARGNLITIPHSAAIQVVNASRNWSRVDYRVAVDPGTDLTAAIKVLRDTIDSMAHQRRWNDAILGSVEWVGVENISKSGIVLRTSIRTAPLRQFELRRALNEKVYHAFADAGIVLGVDPLGLPVPAANASPDPT